MQPSGYDVNGSRCHFCGAREVENPLEIRLQVFERDSGVLVFQCVDRSAQRPERCLLDSVVETESYVLEAGTYRAVREPWWK